MGKRPNFISDGYVEDGYIKATDLWSELRFKYRPMIAEQRARYRDSAANRRSEDVERIAAKTITGQIVSWDLVDHEGKPQPVGPFAYLRIQPELADRLFGIVFGTKPSDPDPEESGVKADSGEDLVSALTSDQRLEADEKN